MSLSRGLTVGRRLLMAAACLSLVPSFISPKTKNDHLYPASYPNRFSDSRAEFTPAVRNSSRNPAVVDSRSTSAITNDDKSIPDTLSQADELASRHRTDSSRAALDKYAEALKDAMASGDLPNQIRAEVSSAHTLEFLDESDKALEFYDRALKTLGPVENQEQQAALCNDIATLYAAMGDNRQALSYATRALNLSKQIDYQAGKAQAYYATAEATYGLGDLRAALDYYKQSLDLWMALHNKSKQAEVMTGFGYAYSNLSEPQKALTSYSEAIAFSRDAGDIRMEALALRGMGNLQTKQGHAQQALDVLFQALNLLQNYESRLLKARVLAAIGYAYENLGETTQALDYDQQATATFREIGNRWGEAELEWDMGQLHFLQGDNEAALNEYQQALSLFTNLKMPRFEAQALRDMGVLYDRRDDTENALKCFRRSLNLTRAGQDQRYRAYTLNYLGRLFQRLPDNKAARAMYQRALPLSHGAADAAGESFTLFNLARLELASGNRATARDLIEKSLQLTEDLRNQVVSRDLRAAYGASVHQYYELYVDVLMQSAQANHSDELTAMAFEVSEKAHARTFVESMGEARASVSQGIDSQLAERQRSLEAALNSKAELHSRLMAENNQREADKVAEELNSLVSEYEQLEAEIKTESPRYAALTRPEPLSVREIQKRLLNDQTILLEYMLCSEHSYLWVVTKSQLLSFQLPPRERIEDAARRFYKLLTSRQPIEGETFEQRQARLAEADARIGSEATALTEVVLGPAIDFLGTQRLLIVPDGALQYVPFQALMVLPSPSSSIANSASSSDPVPLFTEHEIINEPSAGALALLISDTLDRKPAAESVAVFANPVFDIDDPRVQRRGSNTADTAAVNQSVQVREAFRDVGIDLNHIPPLPATREEADAIVSAAPSASTFEAIDFTASRATIASTDLSRFRIIHFATHSFVDYQHPNLSGLVLSMVDREGRAQEGFLRMHEIYNLRLPVDLVVLSACNTGLGKEVRGEGLIGLTRAFMYAGARGVTASLWKVDDDATAQLMKKFYEGMFRRGLTPAAALREAQLSMWRQPRWRAPYYWAAFTIQGQYNQNEVVAPRFPWLSFGITGVAIAICLIAFLYLRKRRRANLRLQ